MTILASSASSAFAFALVGIAVVLAISAVFYVIGRGEDRDRAESTREAQDGEPVQQRDYPTAGTGERTPRSRPPANARGRRRR
ncbi:MAG: hypothetical protein WKF42_02535 [Solirubrobacteraceae bacterium]